MHQMIWQIPALSPFSSQATNANLPMGAYMFLYI